MGTVRDLGKDRPMQAKHRSVLLLIVGLPGAGKTTRAKEIEVRPQPSGSPPMNGSWRSMAPAPGRAGPASGM